MFARLAAFALMTALMPPGEASAQAIGWNTGFIALPGCIPFFGAYACPTAAETCTSQDLLGTMPITLSYLGVSYAMGCNYPGPIYSAAVYPNCLGGYVADVFSSGGLLAG